MVRLRGNTFLLLLLRSGNQLLITQQDYGDSKSGITKPNMLADLIRFTNPQYNPNKIQTLASYFSKFLAGNPPNSPAYLPFNNPTYQSGLNLRLRDKKEKILREMDKFCHKYLDLSQPSNQILVAGLIDVILEDDSFDGEFDIGSRSVNKAELDTVEEITLQNFLVSIWNVILINHPDTTEGADTYLNWTAEAGYNSPRAITTDVGKERSHRIKVTIDISAIADEGSTVHEGEEPNVENADIEVEEVTDEE